MKKALLLLCLAGPASAATLHVRNPHRIPDRTPHNRAPTDHSHFSDMARTKSGLVSGRIGHRTTNK